MFTGEKPDWCILKAERYFTYYNLPEEERMVAAVLSMDGDALAWYHWEDQQDPITRWVDLKALVLSRFRPAHHGGLVEQWLVVRQTGTVAEYCREFVERASSIGKIPRHFALGAFINGLQEEIQCELRLMDPTTLKLAMEWAERIEEKDAVKIKCIRQKWPYRSNYINTPPPNTSRNTYNLNYPQNKPTPPFPRNPQNQTPPYSEDRRRSIRLSDGELREKRSKGLCFKCDEKWSLSHVCRNRELRLILVEDGGAAASGVEDIEELNNEMVAEDPLHGISL